MSGPSSYRELREMSQDELVELYDREQKHVEQLPLRFVRQEIALHDQEEQTAAMLAHTVAIKRLTWTITFLTLVVTVATIIGIIE